MHRSTKKTVLGSAVAALLFAVAPAKTQAAAITSGNLLIYRVGDGAAALGSAATAVFLDEYTTGGSLVQSIALPTSTFSAVGNATTEGIISPSQDGTKLVFTGYAKATGGTSPASDTYTTTSRLVGTVGLPGTVTTYGISSDGGSTTANTIRSATTVDSSALWVSTSARVSYVGSPAPTGNATTQIDARNSRQVNLGNNVLYASNGSTTVTGKVQTYGSLPTGATAASPVVTLALADAVNGFFLCDLSAGVAGVDTLYCLSTVESLLRKYTFDGTSWTASGSVASGSDVNVTGVVNGSNVNLYITSASSLFAFTDTSGYGGTLTGPIGAAIATAAANTGFRGIGTLAVPEPSALVTALIGTLLVARRRRR